MSVDTALQLLVPITLIEMMVAVGLGVDWADVVPVIKNARLLMRAGVANFICVPGATAMLLWFYQPDPFVVIGFLVMAVCPGAPYGPPLVMIAKGNASAAVGLMAVLAIASTLIAPAVLSFVLPRISSDAPTVDAGRLVTTLLITQLLPLAVGLAVRHWRPVFASRVLPPANRVGKLLNLATLGLILWAQFPLLAAIRPQGYGGMAILLSVSLLAGWSLGCPETAMGRTLAITTSLRNIGVSLVIASSAFPGTPALSAVVAYGLFGLVFTGIAAAVWGRWTTDSKRMIRMDRNGPSPDVKPLAVASSRSEGSRAAQFTEAKS